MNKLFNQKENSKKQVEMTYQDYEDLVNSIIDMGYVNREWYPTEMDLLKYPLDPVEDLEFILWGLTCSKDQNLTEEEKNVEKLLKKMVVDTVVFVD